MPVYFQCKVDLTLLFQVVLILAESYGLILLSAEGSEYLRWKQQVGTEELRRIGEAVCVGRPCGWRVVQTCLVC